MSDADRRIFERVSESYFAFTKCGLYPHQLRKVVVIANHSKPAVGHRHPLDLPVVGLVRARIETRFHQRGLTIRLAGCKGVAKLRHCITREFFWPQYMQHLGKIASEHGLNVRELPFETERLLYKL